LRGPRNSAVRRWFWARKTTEMRRHKHDAFARDLPAAFAHDLHEELVIRNRSVNDPGAAPETSLGAGGGVVHATVPRDHDRNRCPRAANSSRAGRSPYAPPARTTDTRRTELIFRVTNMGQSCAVSGGGQLPPTVKNTNTIGLVRCRVASGRLAKSPS
jgi:hypothetical protein